MTILIVGGAAQGKTAFARRLSPEEQIADDLHQTVRRAMREKTPLPRAEEFLEKTVVCNEIGGGVVPIDEFERDWRENTGRLCCDIAALADRVYRVQCGIPICIKGDV